MARLLESISRNFGLALARPRSPSRRASDSVSTPASITAMASIAPWKPISVSSSPPRKKPTPLSAFLEPVSSATQR